MCGWNADVWLCGCIRSRQISPNAHCTEYEPPEYYDGTFRIRIQEYCKDPEHCYELAPMYDNVMPSKCDNCRTPPPPPPPRSPPRDPRAREIIRFDVGYGERPEDQQGYGQEVARPQERKHREYQTDSMRRENNRKTKKEKYHRDKKEREEREAAGIPLSEQERKKEAVRRDRHNYATRALKERRKREEEEVKRRERG